MGTSSSLPAPKSTALLRSIIPVSESPAMAAGILYGKPAKSCASPVLHSIGTRMLMAMVGVSRTGSAGLRGRLIKTDDLAEIKLFAATLLSGAASAFTETQSTPFGSVISPSLTNVPLLGAQSVLDRYAEQIEQGIERDGFYVRVPAGKQFYLYVTQTLDRADAKIGGEPVAPTPTPSAAEATAPVTAPSKLPGSFNSILPISPKFIIQPNP